LRCSGTLALSSSGRFLSSGLAQDRSSKGRSVYKQTDVEGSSRSGSVRLDGGTEAVLCIYRGATRGLCAFGFEELLHCHGSSIWEVVLVEFDMYRKRRCTAFESLVYFNEDMSYTVQFTHADRA
jgi:hypothetical protein